MRFDSVMNLVEEALEGFAAWSFSSFGVQKLNRTTPMVAFGVAPGTDANSYKLAVRSRTPFGLDLPPVQSVIGQVKDEADIAITGNIRGPRRVVGRSDKSEMKERMRPIRAGYSVGHYSITAGTLGGGKDCPYN